MAQVVVVGAGLAGCAAALELARGSASVALVERGAAVGGRVRKYGCKATRKCNNCGLCLAAGLWEQVENHPSITLLPGAQVADVQGEAGDYTLTLLDGRALVGVQAVVVCTGFEGVSTGISAQLQIEGAQGILTGTQLEEALLSRDGGGFPLGAVNAEAAPPDSIAFIQCFGSRDKKEDAFFCSRVCCSYSTRAARVIRHYWPACEIAFFYMELQAVTNTDTFAELSALGVEFIPFRPVRVRGGRPAVIEYEEPDAAGKGVCGMKLRAFDKIVLSEGIHPPEDAARTANLFGLSQDGRGFLRTVGEGEGIYLAGCARGPQKIEESYADGLRAARQALSALSRRGAAL